MAPERTEPACVHYELNNRHRENNVNLDPLLHNTQLIDFAQQRYSPWQTISEPKTPRSQMQSTAQRIQQNQVRNTWMSARHLKRLDTLSRLYAFNFPHIANKQRPKEESHNERTEKRGGKNQKLFLQRRRIECYWKPIQALQALYTTLVVETSKIVELQSSPSPFSPPADVDLGYTWNSVNFALDRKFLFDCFVFLSKCLLPRCLQHDVAVDKKHGGTKTPKEIRKGEN
jgi:hypothetical protein